MDSYNEMWVGVITRGNIARPIRDRPGNESFPLLPITLLCPHLYVNPLDHPYYLDLYTY